MRLFTIIRLRLRSIFFRAAVERELEEEFQYHLEREKEAGVGSGYGFQQRKEECRDVRGLNLMDNLLRDTRFAFRQMRKSPGFAATAILILGLGICASVSIFAFVDAALIKPLPYRNPSRLMSLNGVTEGCPVCTVSYLDFLDWKKLSTSFQSMAAYVYLPLTLTSPSGPQPTSSIRVTDDFFRVLGVTPVLGRDFYPGEDALNAPKTVLLSYATWQQRYGANPGVLGQPAILEGTPFTIIGVLPRDFQFASTAVEFWSPLRFFPNSCEARRGCHGDHVIGRLKDGVSEQAALAELSAIAKRMEEKYPDTNRGQGATIVLLSSLMTGNIRPILFLSLAGAALLLAISGVNVASLLLVRSESRKREISVRSALGASQARILVQFATEGLILAATGCALGLMLASWTMHLLTSLIPAEMVTEMPFLLGLGLNPRVLAFAGAIAIAAALLFSFTPALHFSLSTTREGMAEGTRGSSGRGWQRLGSKLVAVELATAVVLLVGAGLLGKSLYQVLHVHLGFDADHVVTVQITPPRSYAQGDKAITFERELLSRAGNLPGVKAVGLSGTLPAQSWDSATWIRVVGKPIQGKHNEVPQRSVNSTYFSTLGARLARGRYFTATEDVTTTQAAIINQSFAKRYFPGEDPIGKQLVYELGAQAPMQIVGVVEDVKEGQIDTADRSVLYVPFVMYAGGACNVIVRASGDENAALSGLTSTIRQIEPNTVMRYAATLTERINNTQSAYLRRSSAVLIGGFAALALLLSVVGLYGVVAYSVSQRTREIGVRIALGADRGSVCQLVLKEALTLTVIGMTIGLGCSLGAATFIRSLLFGVGTWDIETFATVAVVLGLSATRASFIPARHAASVNPVEALRAE
jgi:macrolide transport system ATP-binding/permease protein